jgi:hypothetical protein
VGEVASSNLVVPTILIFNELDEKLWSDRTNDNFDFVPIEPIFFLATSTFRKIAI